MNNFKLEMMIKRLKIQAHKIRKIKIRINLNLNKQKNRYNNNKVICLNKQNKNKRKKVIKEKRYKRMIILMMNKKFL